MNNERKVAVSNDIPKDLQPIYRAETATEAVKEARNIVANSTVSKQAKLLDSPAFTDIVSGALANLDQRKDKGTKRLLDSFDRDIRDEALRFFPQKDN